MRGGPVVWRRRAPGWDLELSRVGWLCAVALLCSCTFGSRQHPRQADSVHPPPNPGAGGAQRRDAQSVLMGVPPVERGPGSPEVKDRADSSKPDCARQAEPTRVAGSWRWTGVEYQWQPAGWQCSDQAWRR